MNRTSPNSFTDILAHRAEHTPERTAYHFVSGEDTDTVSYAQLYRSVLAASAALREHARPGERVLLLPGPGERFVVAFLAALHSGLIAVPSYPPVNPKNLARLRAVSADATPVAVVADAPVLDLLPADDPVFAGLARLDAATLGAGTPDPVAAVPASPAFLQYTSGSTGVPKGVMVTHANLLHNSAVIAGQMRLDDGSTLVSWLPPYHDMGLVGGVLQPLFSGFPGVLTPPMEFLQQPMRWLRLISRFGATVSGGPDFAFELCVRRYRPDTADDDDLDLSSWTVAFSGSEPIRPSTLNRFTETFAPRGFHRSAWFPCYGLAEATLFVSGGPVGAPEPVTRTVASDGPDGGTEHVACGQLPDDLDVRIVAQDGDTPLPDGEVGEIVVAGASVTAGYWNGRAPEQFGLRLPGRAEPFLRTGDLGLIADGQLYITGRLKDVLIIRGRNHYPQDVEACAERSHDLVRAHGVAAFTAPGADGDRLVVVAEMFQRKDPEEIAAATAAIRRAVAEELGLHVHTVTPVRARALPRTANGKLQRQECRRQFLDGALNLLVSAGQEAAR
ncbi:fatty acyl-AMP ligase [Goodfellowiella coeruleoviolacea]|uniref:Acyl-CoA synthetase (AMP-forming)/AMP-acid ligase II n=1 Tax=Goodfellowiella coeruleoviolacea TaxID=334858 RepID=A0AAE3KJP0_9PSEU|nr:fatty acyl-AMP ligase [Goodfellowiella coeruleoviolacea]MCP2168574.1 Acyl-CoA synthetase (AMP-forming)/AMP-acid ligase II [Goodfellowiella coeruleoviolacea]